MVDTTARGGFDMTDHHLYISWGGEIVQIIKN